MSAATVGVFNANDRLANGWRMPSTAEDVLADTHRAEAAAVGERRKRLDLLSFILDILRAERAATNRTPTPQHAGWSTWTPAGFWRVTSLLR